MCCRQLPLSYLASIGPGRTCCAPLWKDPGPKELASLSFGTNVVKSYWCAFPAWSETSELLQSWRAPFRPAFTFWLSAWTLVCCRARECTRQGGALTWPSETSSPSGLKLRICSFLPSAFLSLAARFCRRTSRTLLSCESGSQMEGLCYSG